MPPSAYRVGALNYVLKSIKIFIYSHKVNNKLCRVEIRDTKFSPGGEV